MDKKEDLLLHETYNAFKFPTLDIVNTIFLITNYKNPYTKELKEISCIKKESKINKRKQEK